VNAKQKITSRIIWILVAAAVVILGAWPVRYLASPQWEVFVVRENGQPIPSMNVCLVYENYSAEGADHEITLKTDEHGRAFFPPRYRRASLFQRVLYTVLAARAFVHASFGRHAYVFAFGDGYEGIDGTDWRGTPESLQSKIVIKTPQ